MQEKRYNKKGTAGQQCSSTAGQGCWSSQFSRAAGQGCWSSQFSRAAGQGVVLEQQVTAKHGSSMTSAVFLRERVHHAYKNKTRWYL
jgi:hypothetical protein